jgi:hypothetical protein
LGGGDHGLGPGLRGHFRAQEGQPVFQSVEQAGLRRREEAEAKHADGDDHHGRDGEVEGGTVGKVFRHRPGRGCFRTFRNLAQLGHFARERLLAGHGREDLVHADFPGRIGQGGIRILRRLRGAGLFGDPGGILPGGILLLGQHAGDFVRVHDSAAHKHCVRGGGITRHRVIVTEKLEAKGRNIIQGFDFERHRSSFFRLGRVWALKIK